MARMTGGQAIIRALKDNGVGTIFGIPGVQLDHFFNALYDERNEIRFIQTRHEQGAAYMAFGYAQSTGRPGVCAVVPGPGFLNATAALATGYACNVPMVCLAGQLPLAQIGRGHGLLHEIPDQLAIASGLTKWAARIDHPNEAPQRVAEAFRQAMSGRRRPVVVEAPLDVLGQLAEVGSPATDGIAPPPAPDPDMVERAAQSLGRAERPVIFAGGGVLGAEAELLELARMLEAPVVLSRTSMGAIDYRSDFAHYLPAGHRLWANADAALAVGTRFQPQLSSWGRDDGIKIVRLEIDPVEMTRIGRPHVALQADAKAGLAALLAAVPRHNRARASRADERRALKAWLQGECAKLEPQNSYLAALRRALPEDGIFVEDLTQVCYVGRFAFPVYAPRTYLTASYQGTLGFSFATALGAKVANPGRPVLSVSGDGGFMYTAAELATAVQHGLQVVAVVFNDGAYGNVRRIQKDTFAGRTIGSDLRNPDFVRLAEATGARGLRVGTPDALERAVMDGFRHPGPTVIEVPLGEVPDPWHLIHLGKVRPVKA
jgi:acetolactate synthase-1/2/3 large subunit